MKADIFRILILYHYGGIYIDIKSILININEMLKNIQIKTFTQHHLKRINYLK